MKEFDESKHPRAADGKFTDGSGDGNVLVVASGTYSNPKVRHMIRCKSNEHMYEIIERLEKL